MDNGGDPYHEEINVYRQDCHNHMRNVWIKHVTIRLSNYLNDLLATDLENIHFRYRVSTMFDAVLCAVDKERMIVKKNRQGFTVPNGFVPEIIVNVITRYPLQSILASFLYQ